MNKKHPLFRIIGFAKEYKIFFVLSVLCAFINVACQVSAPYILGDAVNLMVGKGAVPVGKVAVYAGLLAGIYMLSAISTWGATAMTHILMHGSIKRMRNDIFDKINRLPVKYLDGCSRGEIVSIVINDVNAVGEGMLHAYLQLFTGVGVILGTIVFMFIVDYRVALFVVLVTPVSVLISTIIAKRSQVLFRRQQDALGHLTGYAKEYIGGQPEVRTFGCGERVEKQFGIINDDLCKISQKAHFFSALSNPTTRAISNICYAGSALLGIAFKLSIGEITSFLMYTNHYGKPFNEITAVISDVQLAVASASRVLNILDEEEEAPDFDLADIGQLRGDVRFEHVKFSYSPDTPLIKDFSCDFKAGERVAIVGLTGAGKTTIVNLIMRYYNPQSGAIYFDGKNSSEYTRASLRDNLGIVTQFTWLKSGTIADNVRYGASNATMEDVIRVCKATYCHDFIMQLGGYDRVIDAESNTLSEGQKQLLSIARVMLSNASILVMDEATSNIDTLKESEVLAAYTEMMKGKTCFVVAHRLATITGSDKIIVIKDGDIVEVGKHEELMASGGYYYELYSAQFA